MELGSIYRYDRINGEEHTIFVYDISRQSVKVQGECEVSETTCAIGINLQDSSDIRKIPQKFWHYWTKVV
jgi:hypothetical protein